MKMKKVNFLIIFLFVFSQFIFSQNDSLFKCKFLEFDFSESFFYSYENLNYMFIFHPNFDEHDGIVLSKFDDEKSNEYDAFVSSKKIFFGLDEESLKSAVEALDRMKYDENESIFNESVDTIDYIVMIDASNDMIDFGNDIYFYFFVLVDRMGSNFLFNLFVYGPKDVNYLSFSMNDDVIDVFLSKMKNFERSEKN